MKQILVGIIGLTIILFLGSVLDVHVSTTTTQASKDNPMQGELNKISELQQKFVNAVPVPDLQTSSERKNVSRRAQLFNSEDKISYIYLVSYGKVMAFYTVQGKVSSLRSYMSPTEQLVDYQGRKCDGSWDNSCSQSSAYTVSAPDIDGTYGENVEGIFFFTTEGAYVEWKGEYMMSDQPLKLTTQPELVREIK